MTRDPISGGFPPLGEGWRMPAEWEPHEATWLAWPHNKSDWPGKFPPIPWVFADIIRHLHTGEFVHLLVNDTKAETQVRSVLTKAHVDLTRIRFFPIPTNRVWTRDFGPLFLVNKKGSVGFTKWHFNSWAKYDDWQQDDRVGESLMRTLDMPHWKPAVDGRQIVLEGGSIDVNGLGLMLTTEECLLSSVQVRNPELSKEQLEQTFDHYLGVKKVLWLNRGIAGDDTHGHIDDLARFVAPNRVVTVVEDNQADPNFELLQENLGRLKEMTNLTGKSLDVVPLPMPSQVFFKGQRLPASYANFYIANEKVLVPTFNDVNDRRALAILADQFPGRQVVGIHALDLVWGLGTLHCMTQQQPRG